MRDTKINNEVYFNKNIVKRWKKECSKYNNIIIFSPYITSRTAEVVTEHVSNCIIYTLFDSEVFITQSSSINTLIKMKKRGFDLYSIEGLHAKLVLIDNKYITIGSQNLTNNGCRNIEGTIFTDDRKIIGKVKNVISELVQKREKITIEMLEDMKSSIIPLVKDFNQLKKKFTDIDVNIGKNKLKREIQKKEREKLRKIAHKKENVRKISEITTTLIKYEKSKKDVYGRAKLLKNSQNTSTFSFKPIHNTDLTNWVFKSNRVVLIWLNRYLCLMSETGKLAWVRVAKTRFTYFSQGVVLHKEYFFKNQPFKIEFRAIWNLTTDSKYNLKITIKPSESEFSIKYNAWFNIKSLKVDLIEQNEFDFQKIFFEKIIDQNKSEFKEELRNILLASFRYGNNLTGVNANRYFGDVSKVFKLSLYDINDKALLVFNKVD